MASKETNDTVQVTLSGCAYTLGKKYTDKVLGNEGIATAGVSYLTGCDQLQLKWNDTTGRPVSEWVDITNIVEVEAPLSLKGGPAPNICSKHP
jgi:hypothetical protein